MLFHGLVDPPTGEISVTTDDYSLVNEDYDLPKAPQARFVTTNKSGMAFPFYKTLKYRKPLFPSIFVNNRYRSTNLELCNIIVEAS